MAFPWFRLESTMVDHTKTLQLSDKLNEPLAGWYVIRLWSWAARFASSGIVRAQQVPFLERLLSWPGPEGTLLSALIECGWLERVNGSGDILVHDWEEMQQKAAERAKQNTERTRRWRAKRQESDDKERDSKSVYVDKERDSKSVYVDKERDVTQCDAGTRRDVTRREEEEDPFGVEPTVEVPITIKDLSESKQPQVKKDPGSRRTPEGPVGGLRDNLEALWRASKGADYAWRSADDNAVGALLGQAHGDWAEIQRRFGIALRWQGFPTCGGVTDLSKFWNNYASEQPNRTIGTQGPGRHPNGEKKCVVWKPGQTHVFENE